LYPWFYVGIVVPVRVPKIRRTDAESPTNGLERNKRSPPLVRVPTIRRTDAESPTNGLERNKRSPPLSRLEESDTETYLQMNYAEKYNAAE
jgi:hypothetical protein